MLNSFYNYSDICKHNIIYKNESYEEIYDESTEYQIILLKIDGKLNAENYKELMEVFKSVFKFFSSVKIQTRISEIAEDRIVMLNHYSNNSFYSIKKLPKKFISNLHNQIFYSTLPPIVIVMGTLFDDINNFNIECSKCINHLKYDDNPAKQKVIYVKNSYNNNDKEFDLPKMKLEIKDAILSEKDNQVNALIDKYLFSNNLGEEEVKNIAYNMLLLIQLVLGELNIKKEKFIKTNLVLYKELTDIDDIDELECWLSNILNKTRKYVNKKINTDTKGIIKEIKLYIDSNYDKKLTVNIIANKMYFSPNYLNALFKKETGHTIPNYITLVRIENAKRLLVNTKLRLYEIVERVGYKHSAYFNSLFEEYVGMTPIKYRSFVRNQSIIKNNIH